MSNIKLYNIMIIIILLLHSSLLLADGVLMEDDEYGESSSDGTYTGFVETTYDDPNWALCISDGLLRENYCTENWYEKVFEPCYWYGDDPRFNRYWKFETGANTAQAFPMAAFGDVDLDPDWIGTHDSLYVREGFEFQLYYNTEEPNDMRELEPATPYLAGPKYVSHEYARDNSPNGYEPGTYFVPGYIGAMKDYSIIIFNYKVKLYKTDDADAGGVVPGDSLTYEITYNPNGHDDTNVVITDYLPVEVEYEYIDPNTMETDANYDPNNHTYTWQIGEIDANDSNESVTLTVKVNEVAEPKGEFMNYCEIEGDNYFAARRVYTNVDCWNPGILYVNKDVNGYNTGTSWKYAYTYLQDAVKTASDCDCNEIWIAEGDYNAITDPYDTEDGFYIPDGVDVYGGFTGNETSTNQRDWTENETIIYGGKSSNETPTIGLSSNSGSVLDGLTITSDCYAVGCSSSTVDIINCIIKDSKNGVNCCYNSCVKVENSSILDCSSYGVYSSQSDVNMYNCLVKDNYCGIYPTNSDVVVADCNIEYNSNRGMDCTLCGLNVKNSIIDRNSGHGIYSNYPSSTTITNNKIRRNFDDGIYFCNVDAGVDIKVKNNWIHNNTSDGICINDDGPAVMIRNNTIVYNGGWGVTGNSQNSADIINCILWGNSGGQLQNCNPTYCCIEDWTSGGQGNINSNPDFMNPSDPNDYHLDANSPCVDTGDTEPDYDNEFDIDGEDRTMDGNGDGNDFVDMGGDEHFWSRADYNQDGVINFLDYAIFANSWQSENINISLNDNSYIDMTDLYLFRSQWLWQAGWVKDYTCGCTGFGDDGGFEGLSQGGQFYETQQIDTYTEKQVEVDIDDEAIKDMLEYLEDQWLNGDLKETMTEESYLELIKHLESYLE